MQDLVGITLEENNPPPRTAELHTPHTVLHADSQTLYLISFCKAVSSRHEEHLQKASLPWAEPQESPKKQRKTRHPTRQLRF